MNFLRCNLTLLILLLMFFIKFNKIVKCGVIKIDSDEKDISDFSFNDIILKRLIENNTDEVKYITQNVNFIKNQLYEFFDSINFKQPLKILIDDTTENTIKEEILNEIEPPLKYEIKRIVYLSNLTSIEKHNQVIESIESFIADKLSEYINISCDPAEHDVKKGIELGIENYFKKPAQNYFSILFQMLADLSEIKSTDRQLINSSFFSGKFGPVLVFLNKSPLNLTERVALPIRLSLAGDEVNEKLNKLVDDDTTETEKDEIIEELFKNETNHKNCVIVKETLSSNSKTKIDKLNKIKEIFKTDIRNRLEEAFLDDFRDKCDDIEYSLLEVISEVLHNYFAKATNDEEVSVIQIKN